jgi:F-type H+-transporting ATPase subunit delta
LRSVLGGLVHRALEEFLLFLRRKGRFALVSEASAEYHEILQDARRLTTAVVTSALPLSDTERQRLIAKIEARTAKKVTLVEKLDPRVLAGASVVVAGQIIDDTVRHHLDVLREELRRIPVHMATEEVG